MPDTCENVQNEAHNLFSFLKFPLFVFSNLQYFIYTSTIYLLHINFGLRQTKKRMEGPYILLAGLEHWSEVYVRSFHFKWGQSKYLKSQKRRHCASQIGDRVTTCLFQWNNTDTHTVVNSLFFFLDLKPVGNYCQ
jgi:hypothetical protein